MGTFVVTTVADEDDGGFGGTSLSLREALRLAQDGDTISFAPTVFFADSDERSNSTIQMSSSGTLGVLEITQDNLTIDGDVNGDGIADVTLDGLDQHQILRVGSGVTGVLLTALTIKDARAFVTPPAQPAIGGGLYLETNAGVTVRNSTFMDNYAQNGGAIGALLGTSLTIENSLFDGNSAGFSGGGILNFGDLTITNSTLYGNHANFGGALAIDGDTVLQHVTLTGNTAVRGVIDQDGGSLSLSNTVIAGNATQQGNVIEIIGPVTSNGSNIVEGMANPAGGRGLTGNDIELGVTNSYDATDIFTTITSVQAVAGGAFVSAGGLSSNGGPTDTAAILRDGLAHNTGSDLGLEFDQRGETRNIAPNPDIGAFERGPLTVNTLSDLDDVNPNNTNLSLREAIRIAQPGEEIAFDTDVFTADDDPLNNATILVNAEMFVDKDLAINGDVNGDGIADVTLNANNTSRHFRTDSNVTLTLESMHLRDGEAPNGGAIQQGVGGTLIARNMLFTENAAVGSTIGIGYAGAIDGYAANAAVYNSYFSGNSASKTGGAISVYNGDLTVVNSTFVDNTADGGGSAIDRQGSGTLTLSNSTITGNVTTTNGSSGAVNSIDGTVAINQTIIAGNVSSVASDDARIENATPTGAHNIFGSTVAGSFTNTTTLGSGNSYTGADIFREVVDVSVSGQTVSAGVAQMNGGPTPTVALNLRGIAIDKVAVADIATETSVGFDLDGDGTVETTRLPDARGIARPDDKTGAAVNATTDFGDIGAYEGISTLIVDERGDVEDGDFSAGELTLREALSLAEAGATIRFSETVFSGTNGVVDLGAPLQIDTDDITIDGDADGDGDIDVRLTTSTTSSNADLGLMQVLSGVTGLRLVNLGFDGGETNNGGALALLQDSQATVERSVFENNTAVASGGFDGKGGAIDVQQGADLTVFGSTFIDNAAESGGAIANFNGTVRIDHSTFAGNTATATGGAIDSFTNIAGSSLTITSSTITGNRVDDGAGGVTADGSQTAQITNSIVAGNAGLQSVSGSSETNWNRDVSGTISSGGGNIFGGDHGTDAVSGETANDLILGVGNSFDVDDLFAFTTSVDLAITTASGGSGTQSVTLGAIDPLPFTTPVIVIAPVSATGPAVGFGQAAGLVSEQDLGIDVDGDGTVETTPLDQDKLGNPRIFGPALDSGSAEVQFEGRLVVDNTGDVVDGNYAAGELTLREAVGLSGNGSVITFDQSVFAPVSGNDALTGIDLTSANGRLSIENGITIDGDVDGDGIMDVQINGSTLGTLLIDQKSTEEVVLRNIRIDGGGSLNPVYGVIGGGNILVAGGSGTATLINTVVSGGQATAYGGGIFTGSSTALNIINSSIVNNTVSVSGSGFTNTNGATGGGIQFAGTDLNIVNSTIAHNSVGRGDATSTVDAKGAGIFLNAIAPASFQDYNLINTTITGNSFGPNEANGTGGGIYTQSLGPLGDVPTLSNSIVAGNDGPEIGATTAAKFQSLGSNIFGNDLGATAPATDTVLGVGNSFDITDVFASTTPQVQNSQTFFALAAGGIAEDGGNAAQIPSEAALGVDVDGSGGGLASTPLDEDQLGGTRNQGAAPDIGAVELAQATGGSTYVVDTLSMANDGNTGPGQFSLTEALALAQSGDTITFATSVFGAGDLNLSNNVAIQFGTVAADGLTIDSAITIDGDLNDDGAADVTLIRAGGTQGRFFEVDIDGPGRAVLDGLVLLGGSTAGTGGAVSVQGGELGLYGSRLVNNEAAAGGALSISASASAYVANAAFVGNEAAVYGAAINNLGTLTAVNTTFHGNAQTSTSFINAGTINAQNGSTTLLSHVTATANSAANSGGAFVGVGPLATFAMNNSLVLGNRNADGLSDIAIDAGRSENVTTNIFGADVAGLDRATNLVLGQGNAYTAADVFETVTTQSLNGIPTLVGALSTGATGLPGVLPKALGLASGTGARAEFTFEMDRSIDVNRDGDLDDAFEADQRGATRDTNFTNPDLGALEVVQETLLVNEIFVPMVDYDPAQNTRDLTVKVFEDFSTIAVLNDTWQALNVDLTITADTWMTFDYAAIANGEIHGFLFDNNLSLTLSNLFKLHGTQNVSAQDSGYVSGYDPALDGTTNFAIPVGQFADPGTYEHLVLLTDVDDSPAGDEAVGSIFGNIQFFDTPPVSVDITQTDPDPQTGLRKIVETGYFFKPFAAGAQDAGTASVSADRSEVTLTGNAWKKIFTPSASISEDLVLAFDMRSSDLGELTMVGFDADDGFDGFGEYFLLGGSDTNASGFAAIMPYTQNGGLQRYEIAVGDFLAGKGAQNIVFVADDDADGSGNATFSNIQIFERAPLLVNGEEVRVRSYDIAQDEGSATVDANQAAVTLSGNAWKYVEVDAQVGADTVLAFTFNSADLGESTAIGFDTDTALSFPNDLARFIELGGDGSLTGNMAATPGYRGGNQLQRYEINLGGLIAAGSYANLVLFADDDADGSGIARFADIEIFERAPFLVDGMALRPESYDPAQDFGTARGTPGGTALTLSDNAWKSFELGATLTADSWLTVTVDSDDTGELFGIGFDTDQTLTPDRLLQLGGGDTFNALEQGFNSYVAGSGARVFDIPVGALFGPGSAQQLVLFADDDADSSGSVTFSGIELVEGPPLAVNGTLRGVQSYDPAGQDAGSATSDTAAGAVTLTGNAWKYVEVDAQVGADTVLAFTFNSADLGESTAIGFDTDTALSFPNDLARFIELGGDGSLTGNMAATPGYRGGNLLQRYEINLGGLIAAGSYANLVLFADDDADGSGIARFADIEIFERAPFLVDGMALRPESYDPAQDFGTARGTPGGTALTLSDNAWKSFELGATLTADSWLTVTVDSDDTGELFGIGFDTDQTLTPDRLLQLGGGDTFNALEQGFNSYVAGSGARVFDIPVGALFGPGPAQQLVLFADDDADGSGSVTFSGIELVEGPPLRVGGATFGLTGHGTQDAAGSSVTQTEDGRGVTLAGNAWKSAQIGATLTADTVLSFDFASSDAGELALIGFDNSAAFTSSDAGRFFKIAGTDTLNGVAGALGYSGNGSFESFEVDVGALAGQAARLVLAVDDDADASGVATFRDVELLRTPFSASVTGHGGSQDQGVVREFLEGGTLKLTDNAWKAILTDALEVDADTVLHFEFRSDVEGEIMGIGLAASTALANDSFWQLSGVQSLGAQAQNGAYEEGDGWQRFSIDVGATAPGTYDRLVLAADDDRPTAPGDAYFRDIHLTGLGQDDFDFQIL